MIFFKRKKYFFLTLIFIVVLLLFFFFKNNNFFSLQKGDLPELTESIVENETFILDLEQSYKNEILLKIISENKYFCPKINYQIKNKENEIEVFLENIVINNNCHQTSKNALLEIKLENSQKIDLYLNSKDKKDAYILNFSNNEINILEKIPENKFQINKKYFTRFLKNKYILLEDNILRIRGDYFTKKAQKKFNDLIKNLNGEEIEINESLLANKRILSNSFGTDAFVDVRYFKFFAKNKKFVLNQLLEKYKKYDCYQGQNLENCLSFDIKTADGHRYCTWLNLKKY